MMRGLKIPKEMHASEAGRRGTALSSTRVANSSIRFEKLREGIADYEKIRILKEKGPASQRIKRLNPFGSAFEEHLKLFAAEHDFNEEKITNEVNQGRVLVNGLSDQMANRRVINNNEHDGNPVFIVHIL